MEMKNYRFQNLLLLLIVSILCLFIIFLPTLEKLLSKGSERISQQLNLESAKDSIIENLLIDIPIRDPNFEKLLGLTSNVEGTPKRIIAILDGGIRTNLERFKPYEIISFDLTGEGPQDDLGHGSTVAAIALSGLPPKHVKVLNIKILNKFNKTDEIKILKGLELAINQGATEINLSAGVWKDPKDSIYACRKILQLMRRNPNVLFTVAAGNIPSKLDTTGKIVIPAECTQCPIPHDLFIKDLFEDAIYFAEKALLEESHNILKKLINEPTTEEFSDKFNKLFNCIQLAKFYVDTDNDNTRRELKSTISLLCKSIIDVEKFFQNLDLIRSDETDVSDNQSLDQMNRIKKLMKRGAHELGYSNFKNATKIFSEIIEIDPEYADAYFQRGNSYFWRKEYDSAINDYTKAIEINPQNADAHFQRGNSYFRRKEYDSAINDYTKAVEINPQNAEAFYNRGLASYQKRDFNKAILSYTKAIEIDPEYEDAYFQRGNLYFGRKEYDGAINDYTKAIEINPQNVEAFYNRGLASYQKRDFNKAILSYTKAIEIDAEYMNAYLNRGISYYHINKYELAIEDYTKYLAANPDHTHTYFERSWTFYLYGDLGRALSDVNRLLDLNPKYVPALYDRGIYYIVQKDWFRSLADANKLIEIKPNHPKGYILRALAKAKLNEIDAALLDAEKAVELDSSLGLALARRAYIHAKLGNFKVALSMLQDLTTKESQNPWNFYNLAQFYAIRYSMCLNTKRKDDALRYKENSLKFLEEAVRKGFKEWLYLQSDTDFDCLRGEIRFQKLLPDSLRDYRPNR